MPQRVSLKFSIPNAPPPPLPPPPRPHHHHHHPVAPPSPLLPSSCLLLSSSLLTCSNYDSPHANYEEYSISHKLMVVYAGSYGCRQCFTSLSSRVSLFSELITTRILSHATDLLLLRTFSRERSSVGLPWIFNVSVVPVVGPAGQRKGIEQDEEEKNRGEKIAALPRIRHEGSFHQLFPLALWLFLCVSVCV